MARVLFLGRETGDRGFHRSRAAAGHERRRSMEITVALKQMAAFQG